MYPDTHFAPQPLYLNMFVDFPFHPYIDHIYSFLFGQVASRLAVRAHFFSNVLANLQAIIFLSWRFRHFARFFAPNLPSLCRASVCNSKAL